MKIDLDRSERIAQAAEDHAPGWWLVDKMTSEEAYEAGNGDAEDYEGYSIYASNHDRIIHDGEIHHDVARFVAEFSPDVVLKLLARIRTAEAATRYLFSAWAGAEGEGQPTKAVFGDTDMDPDFARYGASEEIQALVRRLLHDPR